MTPPAATVFRYLTWRLHPDGEPDAEPVTHAMQCAVCEAESDPTTDFAEARQWTFQHAARNPSHHTYRERITRPWHAHPTAW